VRPRIAAGFAECLFIGLVGMLALAGCGVPDDEQPERINVPSLESMDVQAAWHSSTN
jgi:hypothetical protein